ncbi:MULTISPECIES: class IIb bacteriocin, lactobin A/cerein 7B family [Tenacibaculum]|uniref:Class IIb bacteriocin, lactobin A/cerein 7B family n=1 Tax=Tenacibaculum finnmarkense genomovar ulcerans TaxID=2781388 RepID=A0A2I2M9A6_9FLAO|nr:MULTISPECIES: class IIb bacteriocin, lactobin A/cerein 7B family [Tenacibaculum]MBE7697179.1 class IIb bacteriocin, lactobin A/cerein 7B family [Tenacibaculum finnmarkense genomovar ulcerans]MCD8422117.1 class IIb bacteriocin, lactobin A/cerein 7B family [Tenacibaculum finnmarkense genomovar ulcerans]MCG8239158.1 class IIb bacteriocin, lactobin A/cerein 7B family [Tenacibaculum finnmarkense genomovar ulcerans]MCG8801879.1 class IIb bacteriocin, lactobin A/cerein 7B family [Tenacibaculum finn
MKNLNDFGVQELSANEMENIDGGILPLLFIAADIFIYSTTASYIYHKYIQN